MKDIKTWIRDPKHWIPGLIIAGVALIAFSFAGVGLYYVEHNPRFCVSCHTMSEPFQKWQEGTHAMVNCHSCHKQSKLDSLHQVWMYFTQRPDKVVHHPELDHKICAQCHMTQDQKWHDIRETAGHKVHFEKAGLECLDCHDKGIHNIARPVEECGKCHSDKVDMSNKMAFVHCTQCHNFLAKGKGATGISPTRDNCLDCHSKIRVEGETFPKEGSMHFECSTCHSPHKKLLPSPSLCLGCHTTLPGKIHGSDEKTRCFDCHKPHRWKATK